MKREIRDRWVEALRSGKYRQTEGQLADKKGGYCCLGVLCDLAVKDGVVTRTEGRSGFYFGLRKLEGALPEEVQEWAGLNHADPFVRNKGVEQDCYGDAKGVYLSVLNDEAGYTFNQIADVIEETEDEWGGER